MATSFIGLLRLGIHHVPICGSLCVSCLATTQVAPDRGVRGARDDVRHHTACWLLAVEAPLQLSMCPNHGGAAGIRTPDLRLAKAALSQLSYGPRNPVDKRTHWWARLDSNQGPRPYQGRALTT